ncbi:ankyrin repeat-containing domain protein, partial [Myxozyma melibiosi]
VPVYEFICRNVAVMRRRSDAWMNATQILKVANFDKPQRTRILEREVQKGVHEKIQGGYGKYQGTWVPLDRGREIALQYHVEDVLRPVFEFRPSSTSPPPAPKHITASSIRGRIARGGAAAVPRASAGDSASEDSDANSGDFHHHHHNHHPRQNSHHAQQQQQQQQRRRKRKIEEALGTAHSHARIGEAQIEYSNRLLDYFVSPESDSIPDFLVHSPADFDVNAAIDDEGHTAFHWACAIGHFRMIDVLLRAGANITIVNNLGQTALIRSIMFTNNYERRTFPRIVDLLQTTIFHIDRFGQTVLHHIAAITTSKTKQSAARYYMETVLGKVTETQSPETLMQFLNQQDSNGDTALHIAARNGSRKCIKVFLSYAANPQIPNKQGQTAQNMLFGSGGAHQNGSIKSSSSPHHHHHHQSTQNHALANGNGAAHSRAAIVPAMADHLEALATAYDAELRDKEADLAQATQLLDNMRRDIRAYESAVKELAAEYGDEEGDEGKEKLVKVAEGRAQERVVARARELERLVERTQKRELSALVKEEEERVLKNESEDSRESTTENKPEQLAKELVELQVERKKMVSEIIELWAGAGVGEKMNEYRRLISMSCNVRVEEIDELLDGIAQALGE